MLNPEDTGNTYHSFPLPKATASAGGPIILYGTVGQQVAIWHIRANPAPTEVSGKTPYPRSTDRVRCCHAESFRA